jgi:hypothetical protein
MAELIIILIFYRWISIWLEANKGSLIQEDQDNWHAALEADAGLKSLSSLKTGHRNGNRIHQPNRGRGSIFKWLAESASIISGFFH